MMESLQFIREFGLPVAAFACIAYASWHGAEWIADQIVILWHRERRKARRFRSDD